MNFTDDISIVLAGEAGQGIASIEKIVVSLVKNAHMHIFATKEYMSRVRGGVNSTSIRIASERVSAYTQRIDILIPLTGETTTHLAKRISKRTVIIGEKNDRYPGIIDVPFSDIAREAGNSLYANTVAAGMCAGLLSIDESILERTIRASFHGKDEHVVSANVAAGAKGYAAGRELSKTIRISIKPDSSVADDIILSGTDAIAVGAVAGGCNFVSAYPMTPSSGVLTALAGLSKTNDIIVEQIEDEVGALNMVLGAWYAGARAMTTTSGGGFALMTEAVSLAGMIESPAVILVSQRPGPATGLPTRTEQGDLDLVLHAGHGEFPRIILAPGDTAEAYELSRTAFDLADRYQVPVFILSDQYLVDTYYNIPKPDTARTPSSCVLRTDSSYRRFALTKSGISPRGIPGYGEGIVRVDSDEHDEDGRITEDLDVRNDTVQKRLSKFKAMKKDELPAVLIGPKKHSTLIVGWGSTKEMVREALTGIDDGKTAYLHCPQIFPFPVTAKRIIDAAKKFVVIEGNATGQFASLIHRETGRRADDAVLKYNGLPFSVEEVMASIQRVTKKRGKR
ncbi:MAG: 2-oxoacid:acceptor oxidoreductase subunit alpha [Spirochaetota bacterium]